MSHALQVRGTGYRKGAGGRKGNPLPNVYRQWCDAKATACIVIEQDMTGERHMMLHSVMWHTAASVLWQFWVGQIDPT